MKLQLKLYTSKKKTLCHHGFYIGQYFLTSCVMHLFCYYAVLYSSPIYFSNLVNVMLNKILQWRHRNALPKKNTRWYVKSRLAFWRWQLKWESSGGKSWKCDSFHENGRLMRYKRKIKIRRVFHFVKSLHPISFPIHST